MTVEVAVFAAGLICLVIAGFSISFAAGFAVLGTICVVLGLLVDFTE